MDDSITIRTTAKMSSTIRMPKQMFANLLFCNPWSLMALNTMVVDDMQSIPPRNREFISSQPNILPVRNPKVIIPIAMVVAAMSAVPPI